jgi:hypothetical protein
MMSAAIIPFPAAAAPASVTLGNRRALDAAVGAVVDAAVDALGRHERAEHRACNAADRVLFKVLRFRWTDDPARDGVLDRLLVARDWIHLAAAAADRASRDAPNLRVASDHNKRRVVLEEAVGTLSRATDHLHGWTTTTTTRIRNIA